MVYEAEKRYDESSGHGGVIQDYTCADGTGIEKGTLVYYSGDKTVAITTGAKPIIAGITAREKVADDGRTQISVYKKGYFDMYASGAIGLGQPLGGSETPNMVCAADTIGASAYSGSQVIGYADQAATGGTNTEQIMVRLNL